MTSARLDAAPVAWLLTHPTEPPDCVLDRGWTEEPITDEDRNAGWCAQPLGFIAEAAPTTPAGAVAWRWRCLDGKSPWCASAYPLEGDLSAFEVQPLYAAAHAPDGMPDRALLHELVAAWDAVEPAVNNAFLIQHARTGVGYEGPTDFADAIAKVRAHLAIIAGDQDHG